MHETQVSYCSISDDDDEEEEDEDDDDENDDDKRKGEGLVAEQQKHVWASVHGPEPLMYTHRPRSNRTKWPGGVSAEELNRW